MRKSWLSLPTAGFACAIGIAATAHADTEVCTHGLGRDQDLRRWLVDGDRYAPLICAQSEADARATTQAMGAQAKRDDVVVLDAQGEVRSEATHAPSPLEQKAARVAIDLRQSLLGSGYTLLARPSLRVLEIGEKQTATLAAILKRQNCARAVHRAFVVCATIRENHPTLGARKDLDETYVPRAVLGPEPAKNGELGLPRKASARSTGVSVK